MTEIEKGMVEEQYKVWRQFTDALLKDDKPAATEIVKRQVKELVEKFKAEGVDLLAQ